MGTYGKASWTLKMAGVKNLTDESTVRHPTPTDQAEIIQLSESPIAMRPDRWSMSHGELFFHGICWWFFCSYVARKSISHSINYSQSGLYLFTVAVCVKLADQAWLSAGKHRYLSYLPGWLDWLNQFDLANRELYVSPSMEPMQYLSLYFRLKCF